MKIRKEPKRTTCLSVEISEINIYENNWQTTAYASRRENLADVLLGGADAEEKQTVTHMFSASGSLSHFTLGDHTVPTFTTKQKLSRKGTSKILALCRKRWHTHLGETWIESQPNDLI